MIRGGGWIPILLGLGFSNQDIDPWIWIGSLGLLEPKEGQSQKTIKAFEKCGKVVEKLGSVRIWKCKKCAYIL